MQQDPPARHCLCSMLRATRCNNFVHLLHLVALRMVRVKTDILHWNEYQQSEYIFTIFLLTTQSNNYKLNLSQDGLHTPVY